MITLLPNFHGLESESPYLHLKDFDEVCATFNDPPCANEIDKIKLFPFSLKEKFNNLKPRSIGTWQEMQTEFLKKSILTQKTNAFKRQIQNFLKNSTELFFNVGNHHGFENWQTLGFFYEGLTPKSKQFVEIMCKRVFLNKEPEEAFNYLDHLVENSQSWHIVNPSEGSIRSNLAKNKGKYHISQEDDLSAKMASLTRKVKAIELRKVQEVKLEKTEEICEFMQTQTNVNNQILQDINEIKSTLSMLIALLRIQEKERPLTRAFLPKSKSPISFRKVVVRMTVSLKVLTT
ncbi:hypothetical protein CXB51_031357 [Gossypium anomalum]|uniref:Retrotransposon gag domain-containing protein n=1 Tax=Gossypium anomalum TaxID=47600 RepID=A0A8J6CKU2_9ROSI|nr:hypothetical protein CXB51_031357 [Gossypium anomalum]